MRTLMMLATMCFAPIFAFAADIASVNFNAIENDLRAHDLAKVENAELKKEYVAAVAEEEKQSEEMKKKFMSGGKSIDLTSVMSSHRMADRIELERKIEADLRKELYLLVSGLGLKYELIYDASNTETIIYAKSQVDDVTTIVKQAIIDLGKKK